MVWTDVKVLQFIKCYEERPVMWNPADRYYKVKQRKNEAWADIARILKIDVTELRRKMTSLLASYRRERLKVKSRNSGMRTGEPYTSVWFAYEAFSFLRTRSRPQPYRNVSEIVLEPDPEQTIKEETVVADEEDAEEEEGAMSEDVETIFVETEEPSAPSSEHLEKRVLNRHRKTFDTTKNSTSYKHATVLKRKKSAEDPRINEAYKILKYVAQRTKDQFDVYGEYIAIKLRKLDRRSCACVQKGISQLIFDAEMKQYQRETEHQSSTVDEVPEYSDSDNLPYESS